MGPIINFFFLPINFTLRMTLSDVHLRITFQVIYLYALTCRNDGFFTSKKEISKLPNEVPKKKKFYYSDEESERKKQKLSINWSKSKIILVVVGCFLEDYALRNWYTLFHVLMHELYWKEDDTIKYSQDNLSIYLKKKTYVVSVWTSE